MKTIIELLCVFLALGASAAFDSSAWINRRDMLTGEALRLRSAYSNAVQRVKDPAEDITVPFETFPDGSIKSSVSAKKAMFFLDTGMIWAEGVTVKKQDRNGIVTSQLDAENCIIDRKTKSGWAQGRAKLKHGETIFEGEGIYFSSPEGYVKVLENSRIEAKNLKFGGVQ